MERPVTRAKVVASMLAPAAAQAKAVSMSENAAALISTQKTKHLDARERTKKEAREEMWTLGALALRGAVLLQARRATQLDMSGVLRAVPSLVYFSHLDRARRFVPSNGLVGDAVGD